MNKTCDVTLEEDPNACDIDLQMDVEVVTEVPFPVPVGYSHDRLYDRELPDQHPIKSITGLQNALDEKVNKEGGKSLMTDAERVKLDGIETGAQVNLIEVIKANGKIMPIEDKTVDLDVDFTGTIGFNVGTRTLTLYGEKGEVLSTAVIPGEQSVGDNTTIVIKGNTVSIAPAVMEKLNGHVANKSNPHGVTKAQVGLGNVDDTADKDKPVSTATQAALNLKADQTELDKTNIEVGKKANQSALDATNDALTAKADDADVVHKAGDTMTGSLSIYRDGEAVFDMRNNIKTGVNVKEWGRYAWIQMKSKEKDLAGEILNVGSSDNTYVNINAYRNTANGRKTASIGVTVPESNAPYVKCTPTPANANGTEIVTAGHMNTAPTLVHTTGNESINGKKTFSESIAIKTNTLRQNAIIRTDLNREALEIPKSYTQIGKFAVLDRYEKHLMALVCDADKTYYRSQLLTSWNKGIPGAPVEFQSLEVGYRLVGGVWEPYSRAPMTSSSPEDSDIVTAGWANGKYVGLDGDQTIAGEKVFSFLNCNKSMRVITPGFKFNQTPAKKFDAGFMVTDEDKINLSIVRTIVLDNDNRALSFEIKGKDGNIAQSQLFRKASGTAYMTAPYRKSEQGANDVVTFGMVPTLTDIVHTTGNQTIAGNKEFTSPIRGRTEGSSYSQTNLLAGIDCKVFSKWDSRVRIVDGASNYVAGWGAEATPNVRMSFMNVVDQNNNQSRFDVKITDTGIKYMTGPHRSTGQSDDDIVTYGMLKELGLIKG